MKTKYNYFLAYLICFGASNCVAKSSIMVGLNQIINREYQKSESGRAMLKAR